jgi:hypothetical protein
LNSGRQMVDSPVEQGHHVLMARSRIVIEPHEALPRRDEPDLRPKRRTRRKLICKHSSKPPFFAVGDCQAATTASQEECRYKTMPVSISEVALNPLALDRNTVTGIHEDFEVADWRMMRIVKGHICHLRGVTTPQ